MAAYTTAVTKQPGAGSVPDDAASKPHHITRKDGTLIKFKNPHPSFGRGIMTAAIPKFLWGMITGKIKWPDTKPPTVPVVKPQLPKSRTAGPERLRATWLGHSCYYVEFPSGLRVLFDPVFEDRCSPFTWLGPKRYTEPPCALSELPAVDAVVVSHSHYDHLSHPTALELQRHFPRAHFFVGLGLAPWFRSRGLRNVTELDWWEDAELVLTPDPAAATNGAGGGDAAAAAPDGPATITARISCLPCQHASARTAFDRDTTLWCSWAVASGGRSVWFGGDTGYRAVPELAAGVDDYGDEFAELPRCPQFEQIGRLRGPFDLGLIPIGAYAPRHLMSPVHASPADAVEIFSDTRCRRAMAIHWGTWVLTLEDVLEPPRLLREALRRKGIAETGVFDICDIGESREFE